MDGGDTKPVARDDAGFAAVLAGVRQYQPAADTAVLKAAYELACKSHDGQFRRGRAEDGSRLPYITHPVAVARILADIEMDVPTLAAGLLHDVVEDTPVEIEELRPVFGDEITNLVDGLTKLSIVPEDEFASENEDDEAEPPTPQELERARRLHETAQTAGNLRRLVLAMARDFRVMVVKLADRLHNMRTLEAMKEHKRRQKADETLVIFAPLAHRLGIWQLKWELEDLAFKHLEPEQFAEVAARVDQTRAERQGEVDEAVGMLRAALAEEGIDAHVTGRPKHLYSIWQKMLKQELDFEELFDLVALRIIVHTRNECYNALGVLNNLWPPIGHMFTDYIARPKSNLYQSLHTKVMGPHSKPIEVQIRTWEMHRTAEYGVAAHWVYKEKGEGGRADDDFERKLSWLRQQLQDWHIDEREASTFLRSATEVLFTDEVFVFTPRGDVIDLPQGATPIDFAYRIHSDVGDLTIGARVNGRVVPLSYEFRNGDTAEIITRANTAPSRDWLKLVKTAHARSRIRAYFRRQAHADSVTQGRELLEREATRLGLDARALLKDDSLRAVASQMNMPNEMELLAAVGYRTIAPGTVIHRLCPEPAEPKGITVGKGRADESKLQVTAGSVDNILFRRSRCCLPIPGDSVVGYITRGRGMALHRMECPNAQANMKREPERFTPVNYAGAEAQLYSVCLVIVTVDRIALLADVGNTFSEQKTFITAVNTQSHPDRTATITVSAEVRDVEHLGRLFTALRRMPDVLSISRPVGGKER